LILRGEVQSLSAFSFRYGTKQRKIDKMRKTFCLFPSFRQADAKKEDMKKAEAFIFLPKTLAFGKKIW